MQAVSASLDKSKQETFKMRQMQITLLEYGKESDLTKTAEWDSIIMSGEDCRYFCFEKLLSFVPSFIATIRLVAQNRVSSLLKSEPKGSCSVRSFSSLFLSQKLRR
ncbi:hypothetical protein LCGC14_1107810 [marine sediment metagenome]|uniref:Uncharacterized protein n=1 Tax=marine sediment metagenome TaxID=412755 RepID=A0A0F9M7P9_9ZZZZ